MRATDGNAADAMRLAQSWEGREWVRVAAVWGRFQARLEERAKQKASRT